MKITKYPQSCLYIETNNKKILVDPGTLKFEERFLETWKKADIILITHKHGDHVNKEILKDLDIPIYSTQEVQDSYPELNIHIIKEGEKISLDSITIEVVHAIHGYNPKLKGGNAVLENVGYIIDNKKKRLYITSDTICFENDYKADIVALPVTAYGLTMSSYEAALFANELEAELILPIHMDNPNYPADMEYMERNFKKGNTNYKVLEIEESIEV